ncbi:uncharacterized protein N7482_010577 [Penicillium canariense]|uniref:L-ornithine N(5)-oxygenase n=1 Tax=Penicillium canariense TaxID=189055 RepID=A0A9W9LEN1_9EURO|nr:uncharacterized protein N7482_010577 [Penicillium canariense]KAJ5151325.1 hypothetical protein N7482_010577 [Penicillium canariense]
MDRVVIVGAGLYGLIAAKTYLQVSGTYDNQNHKDETFETTETADEVPPCFSDIRHTVKHMPGCCLLVLDAASDIGGTWAEERLYPNLLSQNSYGLYEFSDLPLSDVVPDEAASAGQQFIAGWKINRYLHAWAQKWDLKKRIRLNWRVESIRRLDSKEWELQVNITSTPARGLRIICDKLILATGLTSVPNTPVINSSPVDTKTSTSVIHAKDIGDWARKNLGYQPLPLLEELTQGDGQSKHHSAPLCSVVVYGGAKSAFDLVHFFATLHRKDPALHLKFAPKEPVTVNWVIRKDGAGPAWMAPPTSPLPNGDVVASDRAASTRLLHYLDPCCYEIPKRVSLYHTAEGRSWGLRVEGSWLFRLIHGNPLGRWCVRWFWRSVDRNFEQFADYQSEPKMQSIRPCNGVVSCASSIGIANQPDLWDTIRLPHVKIYRSGIQKITASKAQDKGQEATSIQVSLGGDTCLDDVDLVVHATGYKPIVPIKFDPPSFRVELGLAGLVGSRSETGTTIGNSESSDYAELPQDAEVNEQIEHWKSLDEQSIALVRKTLSATGCAPAGRDAPTWTGNNQLIPYRLFRRMVAPKLVAEGDRSFAAIGIVLTSTIAVVAEVQALWVAAFLTGGFDETFAAHTPTRPMGLALERMPQTAMEKAISEDVVLGSLTGSGLQVDAIHYNDMLMHDLALNPHRLGGGFVTELTGVVHMQCLTTSTPKAPHPHTLCSQKHQPGIMSSQNPTPNTTPASTPLVPVTSPGTASNRRSDDIGHSDYLGVPTHSSQFIGTPVVLPTTSSGVDEMQPARLATHILTLPYMVAKE